jgi:hypothetical protein
LQESAWLSCATEVLLAGDRTAIGDGNRLSERDIAGAGVAPRLRVVHAGDDNQRLA